MKAIRCKYSQRGFSLIEMVTVMAVVVIIMSLLVPTISNFTNTFGRRGGVTILMNTLEQARVAALESGRDVYVVFCRKAVPEQDSMIVLREPESGTGPYEQLSGWIKLPQHIILFDPPSGPSSILDAGVGTFVRGNSPVNIPSDANLPAGKGLVAMKFNGSGQISFPSSGKLWLHIAEGVRDNTGAEARMTASRLNLPFEIVSLSKYTGRAQLDVTELAGN